MKKTAFYTFKPSCFLFKGTFLFYFLAIFLCSHAKEATSELVFPPMPLAAAEAIEKTIPTDKEQEPHPVPPAAPKPPTKEEEYEEAIKDLKKFEGPFTFYLRNREILLELPEENIGKAWQLQASFEKGAGIANDAGIFQAGIPIANEFYEWVKNNDQLWIVKPITKYRWSKDNPLATASEREYNKPIIAGFKIEQTHPQKKLLLVNITPLFMGDLFGLSKSVTDTFGPGYFFDVAKFSVDLIKSFKTNSRVLVSTPYSNPGASRIFLDHFESGSDFAAVQGTLEDPRSIPLSLAFNLWYTEPSSYSPRYADPRVGQFTTYFQNIDQFYKKNNVLHYVIRFNLRKKDPKAKLSDPVKPIIYTLDPSIPEKYRQTVREGILLWNPAFEAIGFKNVIQVQDPPKDLEWDHNDHSYNVIRWVISPSTALGIGIPLCDPRTGEITRSTINIDANFARVLELAYQEMVSPSLPNAPYIGLKALTQPKEFLKWQNQAFKPSPFLFEAPHVQKILNQVPGAYVCEHSKHLCDSALFAWNTLQASLVSGQKPKISQDEFVKQYLREVVAHETGHSLGLRHNFVGSTFLSTKQLADDALIKKLGSTASVMDYNPFNIQAALKNGYYYATPKVGVYDHWTIQYAYSEFQAATPEYEKFELNRIASQGNLHGHAYMTDTDLVGPNPYVVLFDNATDPINYAFKVTEAAEKVRKYAIENLPKYGTSYDARTKAIIGSINQTFSQGMMVWKFVGGLNTSRNFYGDKGQKPTLKPIEPALQRQAMKLLTEKILSYSALHLPEHVMDNLSINPHWNTSNTWDAPLRKMISTGQTMLTYSFLQESTIDRILENQYKLERSKDVYTLKEHYGLLFGAIYEEIGKNKKIISTRRDLQKNALLALLLQAGVGVGLEPMWFYKVNEDVRVLASEWIKELETRIHLQLVNTKEIDPATVSHLKDLQHRIKLYHERKAFVSPFN